ncbi:ABC transporter permease [Serratia sp. CY36935]|uniref:ABC transporter permease n=1 Tax=Serratia sp. CY36935 TaxID=3383609 RepID=UPI003F9EDB62
MSSISFEKATVPERDLSGAESEGALPASRPSRRRVPLTLLLAWAVIALVVLWALAPQLFTAYSGTEGIAGAQRLAPGGDHWLGTDQLGRDLYARMVYGASQTLAGAVVAVALGFVFGTALGLIAGALGGVADDAVMRVVDVLLSIPGLPNSLTSVIAFSALQFGSAILAIATLSFLGYGTPPPTPEWGLLIAEGRNYISTAWWLTTFPGIVVVAVVLAANHISRSLGGKAR